MTFANVPGPPPPPPSEYAPPQAPAPPPGGASSDNRTLYIVLSYLGLLALIPFLVEKGDREVQWHAKHGLVLTAAEIVLFLGLGIISMILSFLSAGVLGCIISLLFPLIGLGILVLHILCIAKGLKGERFLIPGLSDFADKF
jgi:uncharacterized membrane protein